MMQLLHYDNVMQYQNITSNHDMATSLYGLTLHPIIARYDYINKYRSLFEHTNKEEGVLKGPVSIALSEIQYKKQLHLDAGLTNEQFGKLNDKLRQLSQTHFNHYSPVVQPFMQGPQDRLPAFQIPIPMEATIRYVQESFKLLKLSFQKQGTCSS